MSSRIGTMVKRADPDGGTTEAEAQHEGTLGGGGGKRDGEEVLKKSSR